VLSGSHAAPEQHKEHEPEPGVADDICQLTKTEHNNEFPTLDNFLHFE